MIMDYWVPPIQRRQLAILIVCFSVLVGMAGVVTAANEDTFTLQWSGDLGSRAWGIGIGDTDGDGSNEIAVLTTEKLSVLEWKAAANQYEVTWETSYPGSHNPKTVVITDSGEIMVAETTENKKTGLIYKWDGTSYVLDRTTPPGGRGTYSIATGDTDSDKTAEVVVGTVDGYYYGHVHVLQWTGSDFEKEWTYGDPVHQGYGNPIYGNRNVIGDADNDGKNEILTGDYFGSMFVFKWDGETYQTQWSDKEIYGWHAYGLAIADADNDNSNEVVIGADSAIASLEWDGSDYVEYSKIRPDEGKNWYGIAIGDVDSDTKNELVASNEEGGVYVLKWDGSDYTELWSHDIGDKAWGLALGDTDNDGSNEIVVGNDAGELYVYQWGQEGLQPDKGALISIIEPAPGPVTGIIAIRLASSNPESIKRVTVSLMDDTVTWIIEGKRYGVDVWNNTFENDLFHTFLYYVNTPDSFLQYLDTSEFDEGTYILRAEVTNETGATSYSDITLTISSPHTSLKDITVGGPCKIYVIDENEVNVTVTLENTGLIEDKVLVGLEGIEHIAPLGERVKLVTVPPEGTAAANFKFSLSDYDWLNGWIPKTLAMKHVLWVNVTTLAGNRIAKDYRYFDCVEGPRFSGFFSHIDYTSDEDRTVEKGEYFLMDFEINNYGDENVSSIKVNSNYQGGSSTDPIAEGFTTDNQLTRVDLDGLTTAVADEWEFSHYSVYETTHTKREVAEIYEWEATTVGIARLNFFITYKDENGVEHHTMLYEPITFSISEYNKTFTEPQVVSDKNYEMDVTVWGIENDKLKTEIYNDGNVYYTYTIDDKPTGYWEKLANFLPPGGRVKEDVTATKAATNYDFTVDYEYSWELNQLDGLLMAGSPALPPPLDEVPVLLELILMASKDTSPPTFESKSELANYFISKVLGDATFRQKVITVAQDKFQTSLDDVLLKEAFAVPKMIFATWKVGNWVANNLLAPTGGTIQITVTDPPQEYLVFGEDVSGQLFFGTSSTASSTMGEGAIDITINKKGSGEYKAAYEIDTKYTSLDSSAFDVISMVTVSQIGTRDSSLMNGSVTISIYPKGSIEELITSLALYPDFTESLLEPYFLRLERFESQLVDDHYELRGAGVLRIGEYDDEVNNTLIISKEKVYADFLQTGRYVEVNDSVVTMDIHFGPRFDIPLSKTQLNISLPYTIESVDPEPISSDPTLHWEQAPSHLVIQGKREGKGMLYLFVILALLVIGFFIVRKRGVLVNCALSLKSTGSRRSRL